mmetsp:Transcript_79341/g.202017  ORF Transcript_79341/g.202017 Transcript_79341/m.202017 type:complete len:207 (+) Transcript_79341:1379-1999(+)
MKFTLDRALSIKFTASTFAPDSRTWNKGEVLEECPSTPFMSARSCSRCLASDRLFARKASTKAAGMLEALAQAEGCRPTSSGASGREEGRETSCGEGGCSSCPSCVAGGRRASCVAGGIGGAAWFWSPTGTGTVDAATAAAAAATVAATTAAGSEPGSAGAGLGMLMPNAPSGSGGGGGGARATGTVLPREGSDQSCTGGAAQACC